MELRRPSSAREREQVDEAVILLVSLAVFACTAVYCFLVMRKSDKGSIAA